MNDVLHVVQFTLYLCLLVDDFLDFERLDFELFLLTLEVRGECQLFFLFLFKLLGNSDLLSSFIFQGTLCLEEFLLLFHGFLHSLSTCE